MTASLLGPFAIDDLDDRLAAVETRIDEVLGSSGPALGVMSQRVAAAGGKLLRPLLTITCAALGDVWDERVVSAAAAVELVQVGSLVHDDIFDAAATRRGVPTINAVEGDDAALVAGDFILARAGAEAARVGEEAASLVAATIVELCLGQMREMHTAFDVDRTIDEHFESIHGKTARLFACACRLGAIAARLPAPVADALERYGEAFGMAFQVLDDVLDVIGDADRLGKPVGADLRGGVYTVPVITALQSDRGDELARLLRRRDTNDATAALALVRASDGADQGLALVRRFNDEARDAAHAAGPGALVDALATFPNAYLSWALEAFTAAPARDQRGQAR